ncbi:unnamed protein product, partial [Prorocentrum cordatum]
GVAGAFLAFLTFVVRGHFARRPPWDGGDADWCRAEALVPSPAPPVQDDVICPVSWAHPGIVEEIAQQLVADRCVCEVQCNSVRKDFALFAGGVGFFGFGQLIHGVTFFGQRCCCRRDGERLTVREFLNELLPGRLVAVKYPGEDLYHERVVLGPCARDLLGRVSRWEVLTPDHDKYDEDMTMEGDEGEAIALLDDMGNCPAGLRGRFYRFAGDRYPSSQQIVDWARAQVDQIRAAGEEPLSMTHYIDHEGSRRALAGVGRRRRLGGPAPLPAGGPEAPGGVAAAGGLVALDGDADGAGASVGPAGAVALGAVRDATEDPFGLLRAREEPAGGRVWIVCENSDEHETLGLEVTLRPGDIAITSRDGLVHRHGGFLRVRSVPSSECVDFVARLKARSTSAAAEPPAGALAIGGTKTPPIEADDDVRTSWVDYDESGNRFKSFKKAVQESREEPITAVEVQGPPGTLHLARFIERYGGDPRRWWQGFARDHSISKTDRVYHEMTNLTESPKLFGEYDQLNLGASAGIEKLTRRICGVIDAYATGGGVPSWKMAGVYEGEANSIDAIAPALRKWGLTKVKDQNELEQARSRHPRPADGADPSAAPSGAAGRGDGGRGRGAGAGRRSKRYRRRDHVRQLVEGASNALNWLAKTDDHRLPDLRGRPQHVAELGQCQVIRERDEVLSYVEQLAALQVRDGGHEYYLPPEVALRELLCDKASGYRMDASMTTLAPYQRGRVSLPGKRDAVSSVFDLVGDRDRAYLEGAGERMLDPSASDTLAGDADRCYVDPQLANSPKLYARFVRDLKARNMLVFGKWAH